jgi:hypothetical protein
MRVRGGWDEAGELSGVRARVDGPGKSDIAQAYLFLMQEGFSTGQTVVVDWWNGPGLEAAAKFTNRAQVSSFAIERRTLL